MEYQNLDGYPRRQAYYRETLYAHLLFSIATADVTQILEGAANMYIYADDMTWCETLQDNFHRL